MSAPDEGPERHPLSFTQELFCSLDEGELAGGFGHRFILAGGWRITGHVDVDSLQAALDDVVARHEILRTTVVRDTEHPYQQIHAPSPVQLEVRDVAPEPDTDRSRPALPRDLQAEGLLTDAERGTLSVRELPLLRAVLNRFDDHDALLALTTHHSASDGWSMQVIMRDLAASYAARTTGQPANLSAARQYREHAAQQQNGYDGPASVRAREYWQEKLRDARMFTLPADRPVPKQHTQPYSMHNFAIDTDVMAQAARFARKARCSPFMLLLATFYTLGNEITGATDLTVHTLTTGRNDPAFHDTVGLFLNFLPLRTDLAGCTSFREIVARTRTTCLEAYTNEIPIQHILRDAPDIWSPLEDPMMSQVNFGMFQPQIDAGKLRIADGSEELRKRVLPQAESSDIPNGLAWNMDLLPSGELAGGALFNPDEFDESTVVGWVADYQRILMTSVNAPDQEWAPRVG